MANHARGIGDMLDTSLLGSVARQLMSADEVEVEGQRLPVRRTSKQRLRTVTFALGGRRYAAIEQNPGDAHSNPAPCQEQPSPSLWAVLPLADSKGGGVLPATQISKLESVSRPVMRTLKAERAIKKEWGFAPSSSTDPFHYERKKKVEEEGERRILTPEELD